ncbi:hypothetical protein MNBD_ALPHA02-1818 [hydrothermal vent metagenome]|uniref:NodB homology domain-containing protein n=1 Tax=hydrothermal vent metagenome TaxID=652676 RepID=A0A3B0RLH8_9ZZZZ
MSGRTEINITIDTEFTIAGAFENPDQYRPIAEPAVLCEVDGKEQGLGFLLETFEKYDISASFFIECANYFYFGDEPMRSIVQRIQAMGQDVQLHVHPCWLNFNTDPDIGVFPINDSCAGRSYEELKRIFELCIDIFERWSGKRPEAIRTGSLVADMNLYRVMKDLNIPLASNIALGVFRPVEPELQIYNGRRTINDVLELPVFSYQDMYILGKKHIKSLQITSCSWPEMKYILGQARKHGIKNIVILTHPFEYIKKSDFQYNGLIRNRVNQNRLTELCKFISEHDQDFVATDFGRSCKEWLTLDNITHSPMNVPTPYAIGRKIHNKINDSLRFY